VASQPFVSFQFATGLRPTRVDKTVAAHDRMGRLSATRSVFPLVHPSPVSSWTWDPWAPVIVAVGSPATRSTPC